MTLSVVLPVYNERENIRSIYEETRAILEDLGREWELIFVDDGSTDGSDAILRTLFESDDRVTVVKFGTNFGQSAALDAGLRYAGGDVVVTMDADGQNDPADIPRLVRALERENLDCVVGWRRDRKDPRGKSLASSVAATLRRLFLDTELHDFGCTLKAFRREAAAAVRLNGEMHRYIPPLLAWRGFDVGERPVNHRERTNGETKYGWKRLPKGFIDMLNVWFWQKYSARPLHVFGGIGLLTTMIGLLGGTYSVYLKTINGVSLSDTALPLFAVFMCLLGIQFFISGILADIGIKNYFAVRQQDAYRVTAVLDTGGIDESTVPESTVNAPDRVPTRGGEDARSDA
ncbi:glycosyltransferase family 2 protein [Natrinema caseinilyticum]|uniref:glycosyltransferase family 2 protein n=1 Tax=Natrinema caseinilyticum TaxID=2961570 RepID=UPI0020C3A335|nr:glycosyltransferase family 2 protein [Natrinema caseinilyticum]